MSYMLANCLLVGSGSWSS